MVIDPIVKGGWFGKCKYVKCMMKNEIDSDYHCVMCEKPSAGGFYSAGHSACFTRDLEKYPLVKDTLIAKYKFLCPEHVRLSVESNVQTTGTSNLVSEAHSAGGSMTTAITV